MDLVIFGVKCAAGMQLVHQAINQGHFVTVIVPNPAALSIKHERLCLKKGNIFHFPSLKEAIKGKDAVISALALGNSLCKKRNKKEYQEGTLNILKAMHEIGIKRYIGLLPSCEERTFLSSIGHYFHSLFHQEIRIEDLIRKSNLEWTLVSPSRLTHGPYTGHYRLRIGSLPSRNEKISNADLAECMLRELTHLKHPNKVIGVAY